MMKKSLIALAVLGASGFAMAQSSVTLYGVADAGIGKTPGATLDATTGRIVTNKAKFQGGTASVNNGASRVGFTGVEDLGNGNKVGFQFETGLSLEDGAPGSGGSNNAFWARQANVYVSGGWGTLKLGRQFAASYLANGVYDLTGQANWSVLDNTFGGDTYPFRGDSAIAYVTPNMGGFQVAIAYLNKNSGGLNTNATRDRNGNLVPGVYGKNAWDLGAWYKNAGLSVGLGANKDVLGTKTNYHVGAKYDFGSFAAAAGWHKGATKRGFNLGASAKFGAFTVALDAVRVTKDTARVNNKKYTNYVLEGRYALSKRTFVYADVLRLDNVLGKGETGWGLGIRHNF